MLQSGSSERCIHVEQQKHAWAIMFEALEHVLLYMEKRYVKITNIIISGYKRESIKMKARFIMASLHVGVFKEKSS